MRPDRERRAELVGGVGGDVGTEDVNVMERVRQRKISALQRAPLPLGVETNREALRQRHGRRDGQLGTGCAEVVTVIAPQHHRPEGIPDRQRSGGRIDRGEPPVARETEACRAGLAQDARHEVGLTVRRGDAHRPIQLEATEIEVPARAEGEALDTVVSSQAPARRPGMKLPRRLRQITESVRELPHLPFGNEGVVGGPERRWQHAARNQRRRISENVDGEGRAVAVRAPAGDLLALLAGVTGRARNRIFSFGGCGWARGQRRRGIAAHLVFIVDALIAHRHLEKRTGGRDGVHRNQPGQPPAAGRQTVIDGQESYFNPNRLHESWDILVALVAEVLLEIERTRRTNQRPDDAMRVLVDPERSRHEAEIEAARDDPQLAQLDRTAVREYDDTRIAGGETVVGFAAGSERVAELDIAMFGRIRGAVSSRSVPAAPATDALTHPRPIRSDGSVPRLAARARRRDEATRDRIEIGGAISGGPLDCEDGGNEEREAHVGLCTDPGEG